MTRWSGRQKKKCPFLDHVYHVLYNYHVYWIFILTVTKEPSAHRSSPVELRHQLRNTGNGSKLSTPPLNQLKSERTNPSHTFHHRSGFILLFSFLFNLAWSWKIPFKRLPSCFTSCCSCFDGLNIFHSLICCLCLSCRYFNNRLARPQEHNPL